MSVVMLAAKKFRGHPEVAPKKLTGKTIRKISDKRVEDSTLNVTTVITHLAYGTACGAAFGAKGEHLRRHPILTGIGYGLAVWATSYEGWAPALGLHPPAHRDNPQRTTATLLSHIVYGVVLGAFMRPRNGLTT
jgi:uncharacterized membrane protein YagU involved in acid resistance